MRLRVHPLVSLVGCLILLQGVDFLLTALLLGRADMYEANPLAREILLKTGWAGLAVLKTFITALGLVAALVVASRKPNVGLRLLTVMCLLMLGVNLYSGSLLAREPDPEVEQERLASKESAKVHSQLETMQEFMELRRALCDEWVAGRISLPDAVGKLGVLIENVVARIGTPPHWLPRRDQPDQIAAFLFISAKSRHPDSMQRVGELWQELNDHDPAAAREVERKVPYMVPQSCSLLTQP